MWSLLLTVVVSVPELPAACAPPPTRDVSPLTAFARDCGALSVGLDSVATWCFDSAGTWTGGQAPKKGRAPRADAPPVGDCARAVTGCEAARRAVAPEGLRLLHEALGDLRRPWLGLTYQPRRSGLAERPAEAAECEARDRSTLFAHAQARMDLARLASQVQSEYANYKTWLFAEGLKCAELVAAGQLDPTRRGVAVDTPVQGGGAMVVPGASGAALPGAAPGRAGAADGGAASGAAGSAGREGEVASRGAPGGDLLPAGPGGGATRGLPAGSGGVTGPSALGGGAPLGAASGASPGGAAAQRASGVTAGGGTGGAPPTAPGSNALPATTPGGASTSAPHQGAAAVAVAQGGAAPGAPSGGSGQRLPLAGPTAAQTAVAPGSGASSGHGAPLPGSSGSGDAAPPVGAGAAPGALGGRGAEAGREGPAAGGAAAPPAAAAPSGPAIGLGGPTAERERALAGSMLERWRYFLDQQAPLERDPDWAAGFLSSRELRDCRCVRPEPADLVRRLEVGDRVAALEADDARNVRCEVCLLDAFPAWKARAQRQCALALELSEFELGVLERSDDGNGLPPRCLAAARGRRSGAPAPSSAPARAGTASQVAVGHGGGAYIIQRAPEAGGAQPGGSDFVQPRDYAPVPLREAGRVYLRVFTSAACVAEVLPGPMQARTGDLLPLPVGTKELVVRGPCGGLAELYFGQEEKPRVSETFARGQALRLQLGGR